MPPKLSKRQEKKQKNNQKKSVEIDKMVTHLKQVWKKDTIKYNCVTCLQDAYLSVINNSNGYVTDEDLIEASNNTLRHR